MSLVTLDSSLLDTDTDESLLFHQNLAYARFVLYGGTMWREYSNSRKKKLEALRSVMRSAVTISRKEKKCNFIRSFAALQ